MTAISGGKFWSGFAAGALSSIASSAWGGGTSQTEGFSTENNWAYGAKTIHHAGLGAGTGTAGMIAFGTVAGGAGAELTGGNFWQGAVTGLVVSGLNHAAHSDDNGYDKNGKQINNNGGNSTDYIYDDNGNEISSTSVKIGAIPGSGSLRGYGFKGFRMANGAISEDNSFVGGYAGGKVIGTGLNYLSKGLNTLKIPIARYVGAYIGEFAPALNKGSGFRIGISKANIPGVKGTQMVFRAPRCRSRSSCRRITRFWAGCTD